MLFNSIDFALFLPIVFIVYWFVTYKNLRFQNIFIIIVSYIFYGWWDWRFLSLIAFSTLIDYFVGLGLLKYNNQTKRKILLWTSIIINLGFLGFFKYYNFFIDNFINAFTYFGTTINITTVKIILPVGISFYTFQTLSYSIDVYKRKLDPTTDLVAFTAFVSFFPQLVAGPIERAANLLPQFHKKRSFDYSKAVDGMRQILWGLFKKIVIADNCAEYANMIFNNPDAHSGSSLVLGALFFTFQIYGDFSGYSDIAIGVARLFGFCLMQNFSFPYFSRDIAEFWRRWHISLSTWFRDYLYIPLGGSRGELWIKLRNTFIIFILSGFWHGANWTFVAWGTLNAIYFLPLMLTNNNRNNMQIVAKGRILPTLKELLQMAATFVLTAFAWIFFRAQSIGSAISYITNIFNSTLFSFPYIVEPETGLHILPKMVLLLIGLFIMVEWFGRENQYAIYNIAFIKKRIVRWSIYIAICFFIFLYHGKQQEFIYFQF